MKTVEMKSSLGVLAILLALAGCSSGSSNLLSRTPVLDSQFGQAVEMAKAQQTINKDAGKNPDPVNGLDGRAAREAVERYETSFQKPPPPQNVFNIGVSSGSGGGSQ
ncbi:MAG: hypothetical protein HYU78_09505 [Rhodocyclales bacterium]|nr:hypothetical protein [Rhodocyclales bacterium]